jgi:hypothetical protein
MCSPVPLQIAQVTFSVGTLFTEARLTVLLDLQDTDPAYHKPDRQEYYEPGLAPFHSARSKKKTRLLLQPHTTEIQQFVEIRDIKSIGARALLKSQRTGEHCIKFN